MKRIMGKYATIAALLAPLVLATQGQTLLNIQTGVQVSWPTSTNNTYIPQWSPNFGGSWSNLTTAVQGNGSINSYYDPVAGGTRVYRVLQIIPGVPATPAIPGNPGFESGGGTTASNWVVDQAVGGPVYAMRTNDNPHTGDFNFEVGLASAGAGPVVEFNQSGIPVTGGTTYPVTFYANAQSGSQGYNAQWRILWNAGGDTGYQSYTPGNNVYALVSNSVTAPAGATSATLFFHFAGAAITNQSATIQIDDVALASGVVDSTPAQTNILQTTAVPMTRISWPSVLGIQYQPQTTANLATGIWSNSSSVITGDGNVKSLMLPMTNSTAFYRLSIPPLVVQPPTGLQQIASGTTNAIGLGWTASSTPGVTGYLILYGVTNSGVTNTMNVGNVSSTIIYGLNSNLTYFVSVFTLGPGGQKSLSSASATAQPDSTAGIVPLFSAATVLEPDIISNTSSALITWFADRPRARHARESQFMLYDTYLPFYWEQRMTTIQIVDTMGKGGSGVTFNMSTLNALDTPNIRFFFEGQTTVAQYSDNLYAGQVDDTLTNWSTTVNYNTTFNRPLQLGDRMEMEFSPFMLTVSNGQLNYYGGAILYVVGQGVVPWQAGVTNDPGSVNAALDSTPMPTNGWLGGSGTMPYQYSAESNHVFNQMAPNASPLTGQQFMLGRRLHHTDFGDGTHSEQPNPVFTNQIGKLGPKFANRSCVACHANNSRALPPAIGAPMFQSVVKVGSNASGAPDPVLRSVLQPQDTNGTPQDVASISSYTTTSGTYADGTTYTLQRPNYVFSTYTPAYYSVRLAPQLVGMGLLEAVSESTIQAIAASNVANQNGITGTLRVTTDPETGQQRMGRFTYRGGQAMVRHQIAAALNNDMGVTTSVFPLENGSTNLAPIKLADGDLTNWTRYVSSLGVNARRNLTNAQCLQGEALFASANCTACHVPTLVTSSHHPIAELRNQTIHPYTDLLLHDMGPGLADNMGEGNATGAQWRTSPLWSIGLTPGESGGEAYLHDGRARSLQEAILWHGGEAAASQAAFVNMSATNRAALIAFLQSL